MLSIFKTNKHLLLKAVESIIWFKVCTNCRLVRNSTCIQRVLYPILLERRIRRDSDLGVRCFCRS